MKNKVERLREELHLSIDKYVLNSEGTKRISDKFNKLVNLYYKKDVKYSKDSIIYKKYLESIEAINKITRDFSKFPTINEWNKYAKEHNLLCSESLKYITKLNWHDLRSRTKLNS